MKIKLIIVAVLAVLLGACKKENTWIENVGGTYQGKNCDNLSVTINVNQAAKNMVAFTCTTYDGSNTYYLGPQDVTINDDGAGSYQSSGEYVVVGNDTSSYYRRYGTLQFGENSITINNVDSGWYKNPFNQKAYFLNPCVFQGSK